jgi:hypothetical protein
MDRAWFVRRCEQSGTLLRLLHRVQPATRSEVRIAPESVTGLLAAAGIAWPLLRGLLPLAERLPAALAQPLLRGIHAVGIARSYRRARPAEPPAAG